MGDHHLVQVHELGMRIIGPKGSTVDWKAPTHRTIRQVATNSRQVVLFLSNGELAYFEYADDNLNEYDQRKKFDNNITSLAIAEVPEGRIRTDFLAVGADDNTVQIISLDENSTLERLSIQALSALPTSLCIAQWKMPRRDNDWLQLYTSISALKTDYTCEPSWTLQMARYLIQGDGF